MTVTVHEHGESVIMGCPTPDALKTTRFVLRSVFDVDPVPYNGATFDVHTGYYMGVFAYRALTDMGLKQEQAINILRFFREEIGRYVFKADGPPLILSLNDGRYAVLITEPDSRRIYDYADDEDRSHPTGALPLPVPVVQASVNLSRAVELALDIR